MGNAISSLISQQADEEDCVLLSEEHSLVLTCCWVSLKVEQNLVHEWTSMNATIISRFEYLYHFFPVRKLGFF